MARRASLPRPGPADCGRNGGVRRETSEEYKPPDWKEKVYEPDIVSKAETLYVKPGYKL